MTSININFWYKLIRIDLFIFNDFHWLISEKTFKSHLVEVQDVVCTVLLILLCHSVMIVCSSLDLLIKYWKRTKTGRNLQIKSLNIPQLSLNVHVHVVCPLIRKDHSDVEYFNARVYVTGRNWIPIWVRLQGKKCEVQLMVLDRIEWTCKNPLKLN